MANTPLPVSGNKPVEQDPMINLGNIDGALSQVDKPDQAASIFVDPTAETTVVPVESTKAESPTALIEPATIELPKVGPEPMTPVPPAEAIKPLEIIKPAEISQPADQATTAESAKPVKPTIIQTSATTSPEVKPTSPIPAQLKVATPGSEDHKIAAIGEIGKRNIADTNAASQMVGELETLQKTDSV